jgi:hypothetical protein
MLLATRIYGELSVCAKRGERIISANWLGCDRLAEISQTVESWVTKNSTIQFN